MGEIGKKIIEMGKEKKGKVNLEIIKQVLGTKCACYVLISCAEPCEDGKMEVEMHFEGDECLASFLVENASQVFEERFLSQ